MIFLNVEIETQLWIEFDLHTTHNGSHSLEKNTSDKGQPIRELLDFVGPRYIYIYEGKVIVMHFNPPYSLLKYYFP